MARMPRFKLRWRYLHPTDPRYDPGNTESQGVAELPPYSLRITECVDGDWELTVMAYGEVLGTGRFPNSSEAAAAAEAWAARER
jgi:hypothetical protein